MRPGLASTQVPTAKTVTGALSRLRVAAAAVVRVGSPAPWKVSATWVDVDGPWSTNTERTVGGVVLRDPAPLAMIGKAAVAARNLRRLSCGVASPGSVGTWGAYGRDAERTLKASTPRRRRPSHRAVAAADAVAPCVSRCAQRSSSPMPVWTWAVQKSFSNGSVPLTACQSTRGTLCANKRSPNMPRHPLRGRC